MAAQKCLMMIDNAVLDEKVQHYFTQFGVQVIQASKLPEYPHHPKALIALLIHYVTNTALIATLSQQYVMPITINDTYDQEVCVSMLEAGADDVMIKPLHPRKESTFSRASY